LVLVCLAAQENIVDEILPLSQAVEGADLVVLATPMQAMMPILEAIENVVPKNAILTDVGSVKADLYAQLKEKVPSLLPQFVLAHPIAGGENSGVGASKLGLFKGKHLVITETDEVADTAVRAVTQMWVSLGANVVAMSVQEHDAVFAKTSHLPHVIAFSLVNFLTNQPDRDRLFDLAAAGFYDFTRIASSDAEMWRDICITNREQVLASLNGFKQQIELITQQVQESDHDGILDSFEQAKKARDLGLLNKAQAKKVNK